MDIEWVRKRCLSLPYCTETLQWEDTLVYKVGNKMFAIIALEPGHAWLWFKCSDEDYADLIERQGIVPAPYLARAHWAALETEMALSPDELSKFLTKAHDLVFAKLSRKIRNALENAGRKTVWQRRAQTSRKPH
jgi:predicted DNA-binding protein (MmcQ/YjbR family)